jgi:2-keto-4-pentenoate hydratase/2-oxohepta-3-ene-1,7-dioic acid hydratase in catechol pathway
VKIARYSVRDAICLGEVRDDAVVDLLSVAADEEGSDLLRRHIGGAVDGGAEHRLADVHLLAPLARPSKILCIGLNYLDHCRETGTEPPTSPILFAKYSNALIGPGEPIVYRRSETNEVDYEVELAVVIGRRCRDVSEAAALDYVFGYSIANDISARDAQFADGQWVRGKTFDTFFPLGPWIVTRDEVPDPQALTIRCWVGDRLLQDGSTSDMIFSVAQLIAYLSRTMTLEPGDVLATGTPWGVGFVRDPKVFLRDGDVVRVAIGSIGEMSNPVRELS